MSTPRRALVVLAVGVLVYAGALLGLRSGGPALLLDAVLGSALSLGGVALLWWRVQAVRAERRIFVPLALGVTAGTLHEAVPDVLELVTGSPTRGPLAVAAALLALPCYLLVAEQYLRTRLTDRHRGAWLDALAGTLVLAAWFLLLSGPLLRAADRVVPGAEALSLLVPAVDVIVLLVLLGVMVWCGARSDVRLWLVIAALALSGTGHLGWALLLRAGEGGGSPVDALWTASTVLTAAAAWAPRPRTPLLTVSVTRLLVAPTVVVVLCAALLVAAALGRPAPQAVAAALLAAGSALALTAARLAFAYRELVPLSHARRLSLSDDLTGLGNRRALLAALAELVQRGGSGSLLLLDLQRFKEVNDALGHAAGDELLRAAAERVRRVLRPEDVAVRLGGDEFALLLPRTGLEQARRLAQGLADDLARRYRLTDAALHVPASVGVAAMPVHAATAERLLHCADVAMHAAKRDRAAVVVYDESLDRRSGERLHLVEELRQALAPGAAGGSLVLHFQPKIDLRTGEVAGAEALVRWQHPRLGLLDPTTFLGTAEQRGLMPLLTRQVLEEALAEVRRWWEAGHEVPVAVNLSASDVVDAGLPARVEQALRRHGVGATALHLEITETVVMGDSGRARAVVRSLAGLGVRVSVDDYGTGYSSLAYLRDLAVHDLKLDRSFVVDVARDPRAAAIVRSTVDLAHSLGLRLVAEGVRDEDGLRLLRTLGCDQSQSHLHSPPLPGPQFRRWLAEHHPVPTS